MIVINPWKELGMFKAVTSKDSNEKMAGTLMFLIEEDGEEEIEDDLEEELDESEDEEDQDE